MSQFRIFTQPQVKSALKMFVDQLDWINKLIGDYMKENKVATESRSSIGGTKSKATNDEANKKKSWNSRLSFKSKKA